MNHDHEDHKKTIGEELFEVYLRRRTSEDSDLEGHHERRVRTKSVGEELFEVHLRRSKGINPDNDLETENIHTSEEVEDKK
jgi:hypothetical protein